MREGMLTHMRARSISETPPAPRLTLPGDAPLQPPKRRLRAAPDEGAGSLKGLAEGRGGEHGIPFESSAQLPSEILAAVLTPPLITAAA
jgi:hypothetical protein